LSDSECLDLAKERGLEALAQVAHTLVCQFPFNAVIPLNSSILWMETLPSPGGPYHMMRSVDDLFAATPASFDLMDFNEPEFTYGAYEYVDDLNKSLTGKIVIAKPLELINSISTLPAGSSTLDTINVSRNSASPDCGINNSCYEPFAVSVDVRKKVTWKNLDSFSHTVTSGTPEDGPDGVFDSGLLPNYRYFSHTFYESGIYDYYCTFHPWMQGMVAVGEI
jgi:plastocyanin